MANGTPQLTAEEERDLLTRARRLEDASLGRIHDTYFPFIFRYISFRVSDRHMAEDLTSEVFTRLLDALHGGRAPDRTLTGWLYGVASHVVQDHYRRNERWSATELSDTLPDWGPAPLEHVEGALTRDALHQALAELTEDQQSVIALRFGDGLPIQEVARLIGKTEGAVKQLQARAVAQLARKMAPVGAD